MDPEALNTYNALISANTRFFKILSSKIKVEFVDYDPYATRDEMTKDIKENKSFKVMTLFSDHPIMNGRKNWEFRACHDWFTHHISGQPFTQQGEFHAYNTHLKMYPLSAWPALFTEIIGQTSCVVANGNFPEQKACILKGFDYKNLGKLSADSEQLHKVLSEMIELEIQNFFK